MLAPHGVDRIVSSPFVRCMQTVAPLAGALGLEIEPVAELAEGNWSHAVSLFEAAAGTNLAVCSHGDVIPACLDLLQRRGMELYTASGLFECKKASTWVVTIDAGQFVEAHYLPPPILT
jgi:8-oxo-dGTP diphosphatase